MGAGQVIYELRKKIQDISLELENLKKTFKDIPELIESANLMRKNDYLQQINFKYTEIISAYKEYSGELERMLDTVFEIQYDLKEILKTQTTLISEKKPKKYPKPKKKLAKK